MTGVLTPDDNFTGRSTTRFGIRERITLGSTITPSGITASQVGGMKWQQNSGNGTLVDATTNGTGSYNVADSSGSATLLLKLLAGPSKDSGPTKSITVVAPSDAYERKQVLSGIRHYQNWWSCGFLGDIYIRPADVSFLNLFFREEDVGATASGWLLFLSGQTHSPGGSARIGSGNAIDGSRVLADFDEVFSGKYRAVEHGPYNTGTVNWAIPWDYSLDFSVWHLIRMANQTASSTSTGKCTISKQGSGSFSRELGDADSSY